MIFILNTYFELDHDRTPLHNISLYFCYWCVTYQSTSMVFLDLAWNWVRAIQLDQIIALRRSFRSFVCYSDRHFFVAFIISHHKYISLQSTTCYIFNYRWVSPSSFPFAVTNIIFCCPSLRWGARQWWCSSSTGSWQVTSGCWWRAYISTLCWLSPSSRRRSTFGGTSWLVGVCARCCALYAMCLWI